MMSKKVAIIALLCCIVLLGTWMLDRSNLVKSMEDEKSRFEASLADKERQISGLMEKVQFMERELQEQARLEQERKLKEAAQIRQQEKEEAEIQQKGLLLKQQQIAAEEREIQNQTEQNIMQREQQELQRVRDERMLSEDVARKQRET
jgi:hypothetical protein